MAEILEEEQRIEEHTRGYDDLANLPEHAIQISQQRELMKDKGPLFKFGVGIAQWFERVLARCSPHGNPMVYDNDLFPWAAEIEAEWELIREELDGIMSRRQDLPAFQDILAEVGKINQDQNWKTFFLSVMGSPCKENQELCPETTRLLKKIPHAKTAFFSILSPGKHLPPHRGPYSGILRYHLGLIVPEPREQCLIRVGDQFCPWEEGKSLIFDDTFNHQVWNDTDGVRVILFVDFYRPLRWPMNWLNAFLLSFGGLTNALRRARGNQKKWVRKFYKK